MSFARIILGAAALATVFLVFSAKVKVRETVQKPAQQAVDKPASVIIDDKLARELAEKVTPKEGYAVPLKWGDVGQKVVSVGAIDLEKYRKNYPDGRYADLLSYLIEEKNEGIVVNSENSYFWVNTLWALGLAQKSAVLSETKANYSKDIGNLASTGGWTLGRTEAMQFYNSADIVPLSDAQQEQVKKISKNIYRPCCNNPTSFPDCNHGMAALGLIELMVSQNFSEEEIYRAVLAFNSFWFSQTYNELAYYFKTKENTEWEKADARRILSAEFSSLQGAKRIKELIGPLPALNKAGGACGV